MAEVNESLRPLISVITVCRNAEDVLERCLRSVHTQTFTDWEHIVIDGASTDRTIDIIRAAESNVAEWISEPDSGIADAMNKGLHRARGQWVLYLNADDYLEDTDAFQRIAPSLKQSEDIVVFDIWLEDASGKRWLRHPRSFGQLSAFKNGICHQACLCRQTLLVELGGFNLDYSITMDYDLFERARRRGKQSACVPMTFSVMSMTGISSRRDWPGMKARFLEERRVHFRNAPNLLWRVIYSCYWVVYLPYRRLVSLVQPPERSSLSL